MHHRQMVHHTYDRYRLTLRHICNVQIMPLYATDFGNLQSSISSPKIHHSDLQPSDEPCNNIIDDYVARDPPSIIIDERRLKRTSHRENLRWCANHYLRSLPTNVFFTRPMNPLITPIDLSFLVVLNRACRGSTVVEIAGLGSATYRPML